MLTDLFWTGVTLGSIFVYILGGTAVSVTVWRKNGSTRWIDEPGPFFSSIFWPVVLFVWLMGKIRANPVRLGTRIADGTIGRKDRRSLGRLSPEELRDLEIECGLRDVA